MIIWLLLSLAPIGSAGTVAHWRCAMKVVQMEPGHPNLGRGKRADFVFFKSPPGGHFCREYRCPADKARLARTLSRIVLDALLHVHATAVTACDSRTARLSPDSPRLAARTARPPAQDRAESGPETEASTSLRGGRRAPLTGIAAPAPACALARPHPCLRCAGAAGCRTFAPVRLLRVGPAGGTGCRDQARRQAG